MKIFLLACCFLFLSCKQKEETTTPVVQNITESVYASGKIKSKEQYEVYSSVNGLVRKVFVTDGSLVKKGDVLMTLVNDATTLSTDNARLAAQYQSVQANMDKLNEAANNISLAKIKMQNDSLLLSRQKKLWANDIGSRNELEQKELALKNSSTAYSAAQLRFRQLKQQLEFAEKQSKKSLEISKTASSDFTIQARQDGKVYNIVKEPGEIVTPQTPIAVIGSATAFYLELQVDEYDVAKIKAGQKMLVTMDSYKGQVFEALVTKINPIMNERTRSVTIEADFIKQPAELFPNLTAEANVLIHAKQNALTIPRSYLLDETWVILKNGEKKKVQVGLKDYEQVEILSGLTARDVLKKPQE